MSYLIVLTLGGLVILAESVLRRTAHGWPISLPILLVAGGALVFSLPLDLRPPDPVDDRLLTERLSEAAVILSLAGAGFKIDRPPGLRRWRAMWGLLLVTMPLTITAVTLLGWWVAGLAPSVALLLAGVLAPTDPVLAADEQTGPPTGRAEDDDEVRDTLTAEAGLNDGLAFPFVHAGVAAFGAASFAWVGEWAALDVAYRLGVGVVAGVVLGWLLARAIFALPGGSRLAEEAEPLVAVAGTLVVYGATQLLGGYGFVAVFVAARSLHRYEDDHFYREKLHEVAEGFERLLVVLLLVLLGGAVVGGLLGPLTWGGATVGLALAFVIRPLAGMAGLARSPGTWSERAAVAFFGIRGIGSIYYLAWALGEVDAPEARELWAIAGFAILVSVVLHGVTAPVAMARLDRSRSLTTAE